MYLSHYETIYLHYIIYLNQNLNKSGIRLLKTALKKASPKRLIAVIVKVKKNSIWIILIIKSINTYVKSSRK